MKQKIFSLLLLMTTAICSAWASDNYTYYYTSTLPELPASASTTLGSDQVTVTTDATTIITYADGVKLNNSKLTFTAPTGCKFTGILVFTSNDVADGDQPTGWNWENATTLDWTNAAGVESVDFGRGDAKDFRITGIQFFIKAAETTSITLNKTSLRIHPGDEVTLTATFKIGETTSDKAQIIWMTSDYDHVTVNQAGKVTGVAGSSTPVTITAKTGDVNAGYTYATCEVTCCVDVNSVSLNPSSANLATGGTQALSPVFDPASPTFTDVTYSSTKETVATVTALGSVSAVAPGVTTITVTATNGTAETTDDKTGTCLVAVYNSETPEYTIKWNTDSHESTNLTKRLPCVIGAADIAEKIKTDNSYYEVAVTSITKTGSTAGVGCTNDGVYIVNTFDKKAYFTVSIKYKASSSSPEETKTVALCFAICHATHTFATGDNWTTDDTNHWHACISTDGECPGVSDEDLDAAGKGDRAAHIYDDAATDYTYYTCSVCKYENKTRKSGLHVHHYATAWTQTADAHYHKCDATGGTCEYGDYSALTDAQKTALSYAEHTYGKGDPAYYTCTVCSYVNETRKADVTGHTHTAGDWQHNDTKHWKECTAKAEDYCSAPKLEEGNHVWGVEGDARWTCQTCNEEIASRKTIVKSADDAKNIQSWKWDYEIPFEFQATNILNDRFMNADQCYTVCLPYALKLNNLKAYYVEQSSDKLVGFKEQTITELPALKPCVVKVITAGYPLSMAAGKVVKTNNITNRGQIASDATAKHAMKGTLLYISEADAKDLYIMQGKDTDNPEGTFKQITDDLGKYDDANHQYCVLPMRAYLTAIASPSRQLLGVKFYGADGSTTAVDRLVLDEDDFVIYDLQGRRVQNPKKGGLYIINGRKQVMR